MKNQRHTEIQVLRSPAFLAANPPANLAGTTKPPNRWRVYQRERFPLLMHGPVIAVFAISSVCFSKLLRGDIHLPGFSVLITAFIVSLLFFFQLRVADEWKDYADDLRWRPCRPVPRGLVTLHELRTLALLAALVQLALTISLSPALTPFLLLVWSYMGLMTREFFMPAWLKAHPLAYLLSHMLVMPLIYLFATTCEWRISGNVAPGALAWFLASGFFNGMVFELGRKIRAPEGEEPGVGTYTALWGHNRAIAAWLSVIALSAIFALLAARQIPFGGLRTALLGAAMVAAIVTGRQFLRVPVHGRAKRVEAMSGIWSLLLLLTVGPLPLLASL